MRRQKQEQAIHNRSLPVPWHSFWLRTPSKKLFLNRDLTRLTHRRPQPPAFKYPFPQAFHERLLRILFLPKAPPPTTKNTPATTHSAPAARACRQFADFLGCPHIDERSRLRALRLLLAAARNGYYASALGNGPLWTALLRLASGRIATTVAAGGSGGGSRGGGGATSGGGAGATQALARDVVASVRGGWGHAGGGGWDGRAGGRRLFGGRGGIRNDGIR